MHLVLLHLPHHLLPQGLFLDLLIWLHHFPHVLLAQVALVFRLGHPCWPPAYSWYQPVGRVGGVDYLPETFRTWGSSDKRTGMHGCPGPISSTADPDNPCFLRTAAAAQSVCLSHLLRMGARAANPRGLITSALLLGTFLPVRACQMSYIYVPYM